MSAEQPITQIYYPGISLQPWVESYIILKHRPGGVQDVVPWTIMPDCTGYLIFHLLTGYSRLSVVGPRSVFKNINRKDRILTLIVRFKPWGMSGLLPFPVSELKDYSVPLCSITGSDTFILKDKLEELARNGDTDQCLSEIENFLIGHLTRKERINQTIEYVSKRIDKKHGRVSIKKIAEDAGISDRYLRKAFSSRVGLSPKRFSMIARVTYVVKQVDEGRAKNWAELALNTGYFDQSHLIEDFNILLGESPEVFINRSNREEVI